MLFIGDWERLGILLAPADVAPGTFIRELVRKKILQLEHAASIRAQPVEVNLDDIATDARAIIGQDSGNEPEPTD